VVSVESQRRAQETNKKVTGPFGEISGTNQITLAALAAVCRASVLELHEFSTLQLAINGQLCGVSLCSARVFEFALLAGNGKAQEEFGAFAPYVSGLPERPLAR